MPVNRGPAIVGGWRNRLRARQQEIRRRPDGSIDIDFYQRRAHRLRRKVLAASIRAFLRGAHRLLFAGAVWASPALALPVRALTRLALRRPSVRARRKIPHA